VVAVDPTDQVLASGLVGSADLAPPSEIAPVVPLAALAEVDGSRGAVYTVQDGVARRVAVSIAFFADDRVALEPPVDAGRVVDVGIALVRDGAAVVEVP
jgi:hypothetical protein